MTTVNTDELAEALVRALVNDSEALDALADAIAGRLTHRDDLAAKEQSKHDDAGLIEDTENLAEWALQHLPDIISGDAHEWAEAVVSVSGTTAPQEVLEWAYSHACPTAYWRDENMPLAKPALTSSGKPRAGAYTQLLTEYRLNEQAGGKSLIVAVDQVVRAVNELVQTYGIAKDATPRLSWRRNALALIKLCDGDEQEVVTAIDWAMRSRPHWRSNVQGVPAERTFRKLLGDFRAAGGGFVPGRDGGEYAETVRTIGDGWAWYIARTLGKEPTQPTGQSYRRVWELLAGADGFSPVPAAALQSVIRWIMDNNRARFYTDGEPFPAPSRIRKALVDQATTSNEVGAIGTTNELAGDGALTRGETTVTVEGV